MSDASAPPSPLGHTFRADVEDADTNARMVFLLDLQDRALPVQRLRDWGLTALDLSAGQTVVDVGSGTGTMLAAFADRVGPAGTVVGVEPNPALRAVAEQRLAALGVRVSLEDALAAALPLPDDSVDALWCERVLQHVDDPQAALTEFARVLRPGGRAVILDSDHASRVTSFVDRRIEGVLNATFEAQTANPYAARHIPRQAIAAGLSVDPDIASAALVMPPSALGQQSLLRVVADQAVAEGRLTVAEAEEAQAAMAAAVAEGHAFSAVTMFGFHLSKPR